MGVEYKHEVLYAGPILPFSDQIFFDRVGWVGLEGQGMSKYGQEGASRYKPDAKLLSLDPSRGPNGSRTPAKVIHTY